MSNIKKLFILVFIFSTLTIITGCSEIKDYINNRQKYFGKTFDIKVIYTEDNGGKVEIYENANRVSYTLYESERIYNFYVNGKFVEINNANTVILTEVPNSKDPLGILPGVK
ncbi:MAG: hypothetical protein AABY84_02780 [Candidatus Firestonebacteria bacterium]